jgi:hypothetical protein
MLFARLQDIQAMGRMVRPAWGIATLRCYVRKEEACKCPRSVKQKLEHGIASDVAASGRNSPNCKPFSVSRLN